MKNTPTREELARRISRLEAAVKVLRANMTSRSDTEAAWKEVDTPPPPASDTEIMQSAIFAFRRMKGNWLVNGVEPESFIMLVMELALKDLEKALARLKDRDAPA